MKGMNIQKNIEFITDKQITMCDDRIFLLIEDSLHISDGFES